MKPPQERAENDKPFDGVCLEFFLETYNVLFIPKCFQQHHIFQLFISIRLSQRCVFAKFVIQPNYLITKNKDINIETLGTQLDKYNPSIQYVSFAIKDIFVLCITHETCVEDLLEIRIFKVTKYIYICILNKYLRQLMKT